MEDSDSLLRFMFEQAAVRGGIVRLDNTWKTVLEKRDYPQPLREMLGELMAAAVLLAATLKFSGAIILQIQGEGPIKLLVVECMNDMTLRAMAHWEGQIGHGSLKELVGDGRFVITLDPKGGKKTYQGIVELDGERVSEVLEHYMRRSEQLETRLWLAADSHQAAGMLIQKLPDTAGPDDDAWNRISHLAATLTRKELLGLPARQLIHRLYFEEDVRVFEPQGLHFYCPCSRERVAGMLRMLGYAEVQSLLDAHGQIEVDCEFCNHHYVFDKVDAEQVFASGMALKAPKSLH